MDLNQFEEFKNNCFTNEERDIIKQHLKIFSECRFGSYNLYTHHHHREWRLNKNVLFHKTILSNDDFRFFYYPVWRTENQKFYDNFYTKLNDTNSELYKRVYNYFKPKADYIINNAKRFDIYRDFCRLRFIITPIPSNKKPKSVKFFWNSGLGEMVETYHPNLMKEYYILKDDGTYEMDKDWITTKQENLDNIVKLYKIEYTIENTPLTPKDIFRLYYEPILKPLEQTDIVKPTDYNLRIYGDTIDYSCRNDEWLNEYKNLKALSNQKYRELSNIDDYWVF